MCDFTDQNHLLFNNSPTTHLLTLARSKRLKTANQRKTQTNGQSETGAMPFKLDSHRTGASPLSHDSQTTQQDVLYYIPAYLKVMRVIPYVVFPGCFQQRH